MSVDRYVGATYRPIVRFTDAVGTLYDPDTVTINLVDPNGDLSNPTADNLDTGRWTAAIPITLAGIWYGEFIGTGPDGDVVVVRFQVCGKRSLVGVGS